MRLDTLRVYRQDCASLRESAVNTGLPTLTKRTSGSKIISMTRKEKTLGDLLSDLNPELLKKLEVLEISII